MYIAVHSPWLPGYIDVAQTILVLLPMAGLFPDRPHIIVHLFAGLFHHLKLLRTKTVCPIVSPTPSTVPNTLFDDC